jgi:putative peptide zinc metalloprotease protein
MSDAAPDALKRGEVYPHPLVDGRAARNGAWGRLRRSAERLLESEGEREEAKLEGRIRAGPGVTRANTVALISPKGGVGKTTSTFVVGNLLASHLKLRAVAVDANSDFGTLAHLAPDGLRSERSLVDLLEHVERLDSAAELRAFMSLLRTGLHVLGAPRDAELTASLGPERYGELVTFLSRFYEVVLLDLGTGVVGPLAQFAIKRADQVVLVTTPEWVTSSVVFDALEHLQHEHTTVALNKSHLRAGEFHAAVERFRAERLHNAVIVPEDPQLAAMLDTGSYSLEALARPTRVAIKRLGLAVVEQLR